MHRGQRGYQVVKGKKLTERGGGDEHSDPFNQGDHYDPNPNQSLRGGRGRGGSQGQGRISGDAGGASPRFVGPRQERIDLTTNLGYRRTREPIPNRNTASGAGDFIVPTLALSNDQDEESTKSPSDLLLDHNGKPDQLRDIVGTPDNPKIIAEKVDQANPEGHHSSRSISPLVIFTSSSSSSDGCMPGNPITMDMPGPLHKQKHADKAKADPTTGNSGARRTQGNFVPPHLRAPPTVRNKADLETKPVLSPTTNTSHLQLTSRIHQGNASTKEKDPPVRKTDPHQKIGEWNPVSNDTKSQKIPQKPEHVPKSEQPPILLRETTQAQETPGNVESSVLKEASATAWAASGSRSLQRSTFPAAHQESGEDTKFKGGNVPTNPSPQDSQRNVRSTVGENASSGAGEERELSSGIDSTQSHASWESKDPVKAPNGHELLNWDGGWAPAPVEWEERAEWEDDKFNVHMNQWRRSVATDNVVKVDTTHVDFKSGLAPVDGGTQLIAAPEFEPEVPNPERNPNWGQTSDTSMINMKLAVVSRESRKELKRMRHSARAHVVDSDVRKAEEEYRNLHAPKVNIYLRPGRISDLHACNTIYLWYCENYPAAPDALVPGNASMKCMRAHFEDVRDELLPWFVAVEHSVERGTWRGRGGEKVVGYAFADDFGDRNNAYRYTVEIQVFTHSEYQRKGVGKTLMDKMMAVMDPGYCSRGGYRFVCNPDGLWEFSGRRTISKVLCNIPYIPEDPSEKEWLKKWLEGWEFEEVGHLKEVGVRRGKW
ncbi:MAG: hypothetical protein M1837_005367 [Sclerophora amabilis]|nr:MAG: hypothetical protein M1837_005367 [Sclerophora amabilis]